jgi:hypothetical protein
MSFAFAAESGTSLALLGFVIWLTVTSGIGTVLVYLNLPWAKAQFR